MKDQPRKSPGQTTENVPPHNVLSYGGGINSTACLLLVMENPRFAVLREGLRVIFADTGGEWPETYQYVTQVFQPFVWTRYRLEIERLRWDGSRHRTLEEMALTERIVPMRGRRWCTDKWKIRPIRAFYKREGLRPVRQILGFDWGEVHRMRDSRETWIEQVYPLIEARIDRQGCEELIQYHGLPLPRKSGCFFCPFQRKSQWIALAQKHPALFERACRLEDNIAHYEKDIFLYADKPLRQWVPGYLAQGNLFPTPDVEPDRGSCMGPCEVAGYETEELPAK